MNLCVYVCVCVFGCLGVWETGSGTGGTESE